jgi:catechol 2,3-dioxygenase-like lactoylglutathione lyase family enzyme
LSHDHARPPARPQLHHLAVTVTDLEASTRWYQHVFGLATKMDIPHQGGVGRILTDEAGTLIIALHEHDTNDGSLFRGTVWASIMSVCGSLHGRTWRPGRPTSTPKVSRGVR